MMLLWSFSNYVLMALAYVNIIHVIKLVVLAFRYCVMVLLWNKIRSSSSNMLTEDFKNCVWYEVVCLIQTEVFKKYIYI